MKSVAELERFLAEPSKELIEDFQSLEGDLIILGVGGKMGPSLAKLARRAADLSGVPRRIIGVSRFSRGNLRRELEEWGIETISADLLDAEQVEALPQVENVIYMVGHKFGTTGQEYLTWAMNIHVASLVAAKYRRSRIVAFSSGNIYPLVPVSSGGATEELPPDPVGEYAQSCLGRERLFEYFSRKHGTPLLLFRLNYAIDLRYGVLLDIALMVKEGRPVDLSMGNVNSIWQGDANEYALRSLKHCQSPPRVLNVTGPETVSVRWLAQQFGELLGVEPVFINEETSHCLLSNASQAHRLFGYPRVGLRQMIEWTARWVEQGGEILGKPTHFQERQGRF